MQARDSCSRRSDLCKFSEWLLSFWDILVFTVCVQIFCRWFNFSVDPDVYIYLRANSTDTKFKMQLKCLINKFQNSSKEFHNFAPNNTSIMNVRTRGAKIELLCRFVRAASNYIYIVGGMSVSFKTKQSVAARLSSFLPHNQLQQNRCTHRMSRVRGVRRLTSHPNVRHWSAPQSTPWFEERFIMTPLAFTNFFFSPSNLMTHSSLFSWGREWTTIV